MKRSTHISVGGSLRLVLEILKRWFYFETSILCISNIITFANRQGANKAGLLAEKRDGKKIEFQWNNVAQEIKVLNSSRFAIKMLALFREQCEQTFSSMKNRLTQVFHFYLSGEIQFFSLHHSHSLVTMRHFHLAHIKMLLAAMRKLLHNKSCSNIFRCNLCRVSLLKWKKCTFQSNGLNLHKMHEMLKPKFSTKIQKFKWCCNLCFF